MPWITDEEIEKYNLPKNIRRYFSTEITLSREKALQQIIELRTKTKETKQEGYKDDGGKDRIELVAPEAVFAIARVGTQGAIKYPERNWERGMKWGRLFGAAMRHLWAWWGSGEPTSTNFALGDLDPEWKFSHLWHAGWCVHALIALEERKVGIDDRHKKDKNT